MHESLGFIPSTTHTHARMRKQENKPAQNLEPWIPDPELASERARAILSLETLAASSEQMYRPHVVLSLDRGDGRCGVSWPWFSRSKGCQTPWLQLALPRLRRTPKGREHQPS